MPIKMVERTQKFLRPSVFTGEKVLECSQLLVVLRGYLKDIGTTNRDSMGDFKFSRNVFLKELLN